MNKSFICNSDFAGYLSPEISRRDTDAFLGHAVLLVCLNFFPSPVSPNEQQERKLLVEPHYGLHSAGPCHCSSWPSRRPRSKPPGLNPTHSQPPPAADGVLLWDFAHTLVSSSLAILVSCFRRRLSVLVDIHFNVRGFWGCFFFPPPRDTNTGTVTFLRQCYFYASAPAMAVAGGLMFSGCGRHSSHAVSAHKYVCSYDSTLTADVAKREHEWHEWRLAADWRSAWRLS